MSVLWFGLWFVDPDLLGQVEDLGQELGRAEPFRVRCPGRGQVCSRPAQTVWCRPWCTSARVCKPIPECRWAWLYQVTKSVMNARARAREANRSGKTGAYFNVLNQASLYGCR